MFSVCIVMHGAVGARVSLYRCCKSVSYFVRT